MTKKATWEENGLLQLITLRARSIPEGSQGGNSNTRRTWRQELKRRPWRNDAYWLASHDLLNLLSQSTQDHQLRDGITHSEPGPHTAIIMQENGPQGCQQANWLGTFYQLRASSSQICLGFCQVDKKIS